MYRSKFWNNYFVGYTSKYKTSVYGNHSCFKAAAKFLFMFQWWRHLRAQIRTWNQQFPGDNPAFWVSLRQRTSFWKVLIQYSFPQHNNVPANTLQLWISWMNLYIGRRISNPNHQIPNPSELARPYANATLCLEYLCGVPTPKHQCDAVERSVNTIRCINRIPVSLTYNQFLGSECVIVRSNFSSLRYSPKFGATWYFTQFSAYW